jgi:hypothetical protein
LLLINVPTVPLLLLVPFFSLGLTTCNFTCR